MDTPSFPDSFPAYPAELSAYQQQLLERIEQELGPHHPHLLITLARRRQESEKRGAVLALIDRLLLYTTVTPIQRIVVIATSKSKMVEAYQSWISLETMKPLDKQHPMSLSLAKPVKASVYILSVAEAYTHHTQLKGACDVMIVYSLFVSPQVMQILRHAPAVYRIVFTERGYSGPV